MQTQKEQDTLDHLRRAKANLEVHVNYFMELANDSATTELPPTVLVDSLECVIAMINLAEQRIESLEG